MTLETLQAIGRVFFYGACLLAAARGDRPLRVAGAAIMIQALISPLLQRQAAFDQPEYGMVFGDLILLVVLALLLLRDRRWWLLIATACWLMCILTHVAALVGPPIRPFVKATVALLWAYATVAAMAGGLIAHERARWTAARRPTLA